MTISVLIPCYNESLSIRQSLEKWINQTRKPDQILVIDDGSTDDSVDIVQSFGDAVELIVLPKKTGNKSYVQEACLAHITSDVFIATDADTIPDEKFVEYVEEAYQEHDIVAFCGHVVSADNNWLTACRAIEYTIGQHIMKRAQQELGFIYVIPGCAGAFTTEYFKNNLKFDHDTITEDLDFTYKLHKDNKKIYYDQRAIVYTQDPNTLASYIKQVQRWYAGGLQNLVKHKDILSKPIALIEILFTFAELPINFFSLFILPFINFQVFLYFLIFFVSASIYFGTIAAFAQRKASLALYSPLYVMITYINAFLFMVEFFKLI